MGLTLGILVSLAIMAMIPVNPVLNWVTNYFTKISEKMDKPEPILVIPKPNFVFFLKGILVFLKGVLSVFITQTFFYYDNFLFICVPLGVLVLHLWSPLNKFKRAPDVGLFLVWGILTVLHWPFVIITPILFGILLLLTNSVLMGYFLTLFVLPFILIQLPTSQLGILLISGISVVVILAMHQDLFSLFSGKKRTFVQLVEDR